MFPTNFASGFSMKIKKKIEIRQNKNGINEKYFSLIIKILNIKA
jgi:hypothetical protein